MDVCELHILCCYAMSAMQSMSAMAEHYTDFCELHILCYVQYIDDFLRFLVGSESRVSRLVLFHQFCSQVGQVLIMRYSAALYSACYRVSADLLFLLNLWLISLGSDKSRLCSCNALCSHARWPAAAKLHLVFIIILIESGGCLNRGASEPSANLKNTYCLTSPRPEC